MGTPGLSCNPGNAHGVFVEGGCAVSYLRFIAYAVTTFSASPHLDSPKPRKSLGQYFLVDHRILNRIVAAAQLASNDLVVEVGPGKGALTRRLLPRVAQVVALELDAALAVALPGGLGNPSNLSVVCADARTVDLGPLVGPTQPYKVVANLPYYAANPIIRRFLECSRPPASMVVMVQREVAESMTATPGRMSLLSVAIQFYARAALVCEVPPASFRPAPRVVSAVVRLDRLPQPAIDVASSDTFFDLVRAGFSAPRKQLRNSLSHGLGVDTRLAGRLLEEAGVDGKRRAETLALDEWGTVCSAWEAQGRPGVNRGAKVC